MTETAIPIANIYYLYCYAWNRFEAGKQLAVGAEDSPDFPSLLARVLLAGTKAIVRRGLDRDYVPQVEELATVRGRIDLRQSIRIMARHSPRLNCEFDELTHDVLHNRIIKATLSRLSRYRSLDPMLAHQLRAARYLFADVQDTSLKGSDFEHLQLHRNNAYYEFLLRICRLAFDMSLPNPNGSATLFQDALRTDREMAAVFEEFVRNFYRAEQTTFRIARRNIRWDAIPMGNTGEGRLPGMQTDISLESLSRRIIIDTKFYRDVLQQRPGYTRSFRSENLYQLFSYLKNSAPSAESEPPVEGMLIYPENGQELDGQFMIQGHRVRIATVDLCQPWQGIDSRLKSLIAPT